MKIIFLIMIGISALIGSDKFIDKSTGLEWQDNRDAKNITKSWSDAKSYCKKLTLSGNNNWRLPSINELQSIADITKNNPAIKEGFNNVALSDYWSSSKNVTVSSEAWKVNFEDGNTDYEAKSKNYHVRCVRGR